MTQLWTIYVCQYLGMHPYFDLIMSTELSGYIFAVIYITLLDSKIGLLVYILLP